MNARRSSQRGFTLLEVLVAAAILGLGLTVILSSQVGLFSNSQRAENMSLATHMARCRMSETEVEVLKLGFQLTDQTEDKRACCMDESETRFQCSRKIERVELPQPAGMGAEGGVSLDGGLPNLPGLDGGGSSFTSGLNLSMDGGFPAGPMNPLQALTSGAGMGALGALGAIQQTGGAAIGGSSTSALGGFMGGAMAGGSAGIASMFMGMVYPDMKRMFEASIRKVTITVHWKEGAKKRTLEVTQYLTNPLQAGGLDPMANLAMQMMGGMMGGGTGGAGSAGATGTGTTPTTGTGTGTGLPFGGGLMR